LLWRSLAAAMAIAMLHVLCYVFVHKFLFNAHFDFEPDYIVSKPIRHRFQLCFGKYCQLFTHESNTFLTSFRPLKRIGRKCRKCQKPCQKQPVPLDARGLPSNTRMPGPTPLTTPNSRVATADMCGPTDGPRESSVT